MKRQMILASAASLAIAMPATAQDLSRSEIIVTASRIDQDNYSSQMPAVGLRRSADFLVQEVIIRGDTRDEKQRRTEIRTMLNQAVRMAKQHGVELAYGDYVLTTLTLENVDDLDLERDNRPDSEGISFLVKAPLGGIESGKLAEERIARYIDAVPESGRAQMDKSGDTTLSVVGPDNFRSEIAAKIAEDSQALARQMGENYAIQAEGLNMPVQWTRSGPAEVLLYIPYKLTIVPRP